MELQDARERAEQEGTRRSEHLRKVVIPWVVGVATALLVLLFVLAWALSSIRSGGGEPQHKGDRTAHEQTESPPPAKKPAAGEKQAKTTAGSQLLAKLPPAAPATKPVAKHETQSPAAETWGEWFKSLKPHSHCSVRGKTLTLNGHWKVINPRIDDEHPPCRLVHEIIAGTPEYRDETGNIFPVGGWVPHDAVAVRARPGTGIAIYKYSQCPPGGSYQLGWDCHSRLESAER